MPAESSTNADEPDQILGEKIRWDNGITVKTYELNSAERSYVFPTAIVPTENDFLDFWGGVDQSGDEPEKYGPRLCQFVTESFALGITGLYAGENELTIFINASGGRPQPKWTDLEPRLRTLMEKYLLS
jgi:hypothetical protein